MRPKFIATVFISCSILAACASAPVEFPKGYVIGEGNILHEGRLGNIHTQIEFFDAGDCNQYVKWTWNKFASRNETPHCTDADLSSSLPWRGSLSWSSTRSMKISSAYEARCKESLDIGMYLAGNDGKVTRLCSQ